LEWATSCPPPRHNFTSIPRIRSESPAFDLHHPEIAAIEIDANPKEATGEAVDAPEARGYPEHIAEQQAKKDAGDPHSHSYKHDATEDEV